MEWRGACDVGKGRKPIRPRHLPVGQNTWRMQNPVNPLPQKYSTLPKFGIAAFSRHPGPRRGAIVRRNERGSGCGGRGCVGHAKAGPGRDEPREVVLRADERRQRLAKPFGRSGVKLRTAKPCGPDRRCYGQALRRCFQARPGPRGIANSRGDGGQKELGSGESAHTPSTHRAGKAGCFPAHLLSRLRICVCKFFAQRIMGASRHPVFPAPSSLREGQGNEQNSGATCRENADLCVIEPREWCCQTGLNCRPLHYQWSALPLSYGSMCWDKNRPPQGAYQAGRYLPQAPLLCKLASSVKTRKSGRYRGQNARFRSKRPTFRRFGFRFPHPTGQLAG